MASLVGAEEDQLVFLTLIQGQGGNVLPFGTQLNTLYAGIAFTVIGSIVLSRHLTQSQKKHYETLGLLKSFLLFFYSCFLKPHQGDSKGNQQDALESFYKTQAGAYDATRKVLLRGREDMLALVAAQLNAKAISKTDDKKRVWVDVLPLYP